MSELETTPVEAVSEKAASLEVPTEEQNTAAPTQEVIETKVEAKAEEKKEEPKDKFAPKFAALSRKERELRQREKDLESRLASKEAEIAARVKVAEEFEAKQAARQKLKKENPVKFLEEEGLTYEQVTQSILNDGKLSQEQKIEQILSAQAEEIKRLKDEREEEKRLKLEEMEKLEADSLSQKHQERIDSFKGEIKSFLTSSSEHELLMNNPFDEDPVDAVYDTVAEYFRVHGEILDPKTAADLVEKYLEDRVEKIAKTKKGSTKFTPSKEEPKQEAAQSQSPKTLENAHSSTTPNRQARKLTDDELIAEAAKHVRWNKN